MQTINYNPFRLSSAQRIALCPGSVKACEPFAGKDNSSPEAERGTRIHGALATHYTATKQDDQIVNMENAENPNFQAGGTL